MEDPAPRPQPSIASESSRRRFLKRGLAVGAALATAGRAAPGSGQQAPDDPSKVLGRHMVPYPERSRFEQAVKQKGPPTMPSRPGR
jgi:hypothetical protein